MYEKSSFIGHFVHKDKHDYMIDRQCMPLELDVVDDHWHDSFEIAYQVENHRAYQINGKRLVTEPGMVLVVPPHTLHGTVSEFSGKYVTYVLRYPTSIIYQPGLTMRNIRFLTTFDGEIDPKRCLFSDDELLPEIKSEFERLFEYYTTSESELLARASILRIHDMIYRLYNREKNQNVSEFLAAVQSCIEDHISEDISPYAIADFLHISHSLLCHKLRAELGCTPNELILRCKLNLAENLLLDRRGLSVTEVGLEIGIPDTSYFIKCFKNSCGVTPGQFRKLTRDMLDENRMK